MSKYCPDNDCDFWDENPEGVLKGRFCSDCGKVLTEIYPIPNDVTTPVHDTEFEKFSDSEGENKENEVAFNLEGSLRTIKLETKHTKNFAKGSHGTRFHYLSQNTQESITPLNTNHP
eukprot:TRINITY_DN944_c0_g1_i3.p2 TRINITY_DN944_c0_g1~~TRINITY_DN944_c0_g1_i3.p2  ORF type:complete len:117 (+),score=6.26 TRINITY_DN944_c0_g1_i3:82-432(+)